MEKVARFCKVSEKAFSEAMREKCGGEGDFSGLKLPVRATAGSAGYDFFAPCDLTLAPGETATVPTGVRVQIREGWFLALFPRSGLGFKFRLQLDNTVGIIDSDYFGAKNEGHIFVKITNDGKEGKTLSVKKGEGFCQGIFLPFGIAEDDEAEGLRLGGFGSTDQREQ